VSILEAPRNRTTTTSHDSPFAQIGLELLQCPRFVCGHFHANVVKDTTYKDLPLSIRVSSAAGTTIQWDGKDALSPEEAQKVASKNVTRDFFPKMVA